jgi:hypothetical protein
LYIVERILPGATMESLEELRRVLEEATREATTEGSPVRHLRSTFTPGDSRCRCLFEAPDAEWVRAVNEAAEIPFSRIALAVELRANPATDPSGE